MTRRRRMAARAAAMVVAAVLCAPGGFGYAHFTRYLTRTAPYTPVYERFDLNVLQNRTLPVLISEQGPSVLAEGDSFAAVISQIRAAAKVWSDVGSSELRLGFGGMFRPGTAMDAPAVEVLFQDEMAPGVIAMGGPVVLAGLTETPAGQYIPIVKSQLLLRKDLHDRPSWTERFFLTLVHEFGHTLGLQHTWTGSVMSTEITRGVTKASPLGADDVAGVSLLYPAAGYAEGTGTISGRVAWNGQGVALASVMALSSGGAISVLTNPDGTYVITGLPRGYYYVYAQPLPPAFAGEMQPVNLELPLDADGHAIPPGVIFDTQFWPGTRTPVQPVQINPGDAVADISFAVQRRERVAVHSVQTYSFYGQQVIKPAHVLLGGAQGTIVYTGSGLVVNNAPAPGLSVTVANGGEVVPQGGLRPYAPAPAYIQMDLQMNPFSSGEGLRHLIFSLGGETHVQPAAIRFVSSQPPEIKTVTESADRSVVIEGSGLTASTRIWFDGVAAASSVVDETHLRVALPPAPGGHRATIVALNADGQSSLFSNGTASPSRVYEPADAASIALTSPVLPAGVESLVEITGVATRFEAGQVKLGFGTSDVAVRRLWVVAPDKVLANVGTNPNAAGGVTNVTAVSGLQVTGSTVGFQLLAGASRQVYVTSGTLTATQGAGFTFALGNLPAPAGSPAVSATFGGVEAQVLQVNGNLVTIAVPLGQPLGPNVLRAFVNGEAALPIAVQVEAPPPVILGVLNATGGGIDAEHRVRLGDSVSLTFALQGDKAAVLSLSQVAVVSGAVRHTVLQLTPVEGQPGVYNALVSLSTLAAGPELPVAVSVDGRASQPIVIPVG